MQFWLLRVTNRIIFWSALSWKHEICTWIKASTNYTLIIIFQNNKQLHRHISYRLSFIDMLWSTPGFDFFCRLFIEFNRFFFLFLCIVFFFFGMNHNTIVTCLQNYIACVCKMVNKKRTLLTKMHVNCTMWRLKFIRHTKQNNNKRLHQTESMMPLHHLNENDEIMII